MLKYQAAKTDSGDFGKYMTLNEVMQFLKLKISTEGGIRLIRGYGNEAGPILGGNEAFQRTRVYLQNAEVGNKIRLLPEVGPFKWTVRVAEYAPLPAQFLSGTDAIDKISAAVYSKYNDKYGITDLGIYANKPGEHSMNNAIDIGVSKPVSSVDIHNAILDIANYLRASMLQAIQGEPGGLPVNGVIVMQQVCSREDTSWHYYSGVAHVSHVHVSGWPNPLPGWV